MSYWSYGNLFLFLVMGYLGIFLLKKNKSFENKWHKPSHMKNRYTILWIAIWAFFSAIRLVDTSGIGGVDAPVYKQYFEVINQRNASSLTYQYYHYDVLYKYICKVIRFFTSDYHIFFFIIYSLIAFGIIYFIITFTPSKGCFAPYIVLFYLYLLGHNTIRTHITISLMLLGIALMWKGKEKTGVTFILSCLLIQKASALYVLVLPFIYFYKKGKITIKTGIVLSIVSALVGKIAQNLLVYARLVGIDLQGAYASYAKHNIGVSFFDNFWKIALPQLLLAVFMIIFNKSIRRDMTQSDPLIQLRLKMIWILCVFDIITIPTAFILNYWRGYEYFMPVRLVMWCEIIKIIKRKFGGTLGTRRFIDVSSYIVFTAWFIFRLYNTYEASGLMPYIIDLNI